MPMIGRETGSGDANQDGARSDVEMLILLRWVLIIAIAYLVLFSRPLAMITPAASIFIALYLGSNLVVQKIVAHMQRSPLFEWGVVLLDVTAVSLALFLTGEPTGELFVLYFVVLFASALADGVGLAVGAAVFVGIAHLYTASGFLEIGELVRRGYMVRIPFLFAVALFFGNLVQSARAKQRLAAERERRAQRMEFLSTVSHDLRNPLGVIESLADLLIDGDAGELSSEQANLVQRILVSIRQVLNLSNNLIEAERIDVGNFSLRTKKVDLRAVIEGTLVTAATAADLKRISLKTNLPDVPAIADVDAVQIERSLANLLGNAIKFTPENGNVACSLTHSDGAWAVEIRDSGPGIPTHLLGDVGRKHLIDADVTGSGSGLGLFISAAVAIAHGGSLHAEIPATGGTAITLTLPNLMSVDEDASGDSPVKCPPVVGRLARAG